MKTKRASKSQAARPVRWSALVRRMEALLVTASSRLSFEFTKTGLKIQISLLRVRIFLVEPRAKCRHFLLECRYLLALVRLWAWGFHNVRDTHPPNDPSSATRPTGRLNCNLDAMAGFAAAHG